MYLSRYYLSNINRRFFAYHTYFLILSLIKLLFDFSEVICLFGLVSYKPCASPRQAKIASEKRNLCSMRLQTLCLSEAKIASEKRNICSMRLHTLRPSEAKIASEKRNICSMRLHTLRPSEAKIKIGRWTNSFGEA